MGRQATSNDQGRITGVTKTNVAPAESLGGPKIETLAQSVTLLLAITVVQRAIGFARGVLLCRWLDPDELGQWDLALGFLMLAAPVAVLGLPGSFGAIWSITAAAASRDCSCGGWRFASPCCRWRRRFFWGWAAAGFRNSSLAGLTAKRSCR